MYKRRKILLAIFSVFILTSSFFLIKNAFASFTGGTGTAGDPYQISTCSQLQEAGSYVTSNFILANDIDCSDTVNWNSGAGFMPIGTSTVNKFTGSFNGAGHKISGLTINRPAMNNVGLFGYTSNTANIYKVGLFNASTTGSQDVGGLIGYNTGTTTESYFIGTVTTTSNGAGGNAGGLVGSNAGGRIINCYMRGTIISTYNNASTGGLIGAFGSGLVENSYTASVINNTGTYGRGFISGYGGGTVTASLWDISVSGKTVGGGGTGTSTSLMKNLATPSFYGWNISSVWNIDPNKNNGYPYLLNNDSGIDQIRPIYTVGDLQNISANPGDRYIQMADIDASASASWNGGAGFAPIPIFYGQYEGNGYIITNLTVNRPAENYVGLFGQNRGFLNNVKIADSSFTGNTYVGSLAGYNDGVTYRSKSYRFANSSNQVTGYNTVGGLVGQNNTTGSISQGYAVANVTITYGNPGGNAGGLVGINLGFIDNTYARGSINSPTNNDSTGGLIGALSSGRVTNSFAASVINNAGTYGRGFISGASGGTVTASFWDITVSGKVTGGGGTGTTTLAMKTVSTFTDVGWDFASGNVWHMDPEGLKDDGYPYLNPPILPNLEIWTIDDLQNISVNPDRNYVQMADIDASASASWNGGAGFAPVPIFTGTYNGNGYKITNLLINRPAENYVGIFGQNRGVIQNLEIVSSSITGNTYVGSVTGYNIGTVYRLRNYGASTSIGGYQSVGGLVGDNGSTGVISQSYAISDVSISFNGPTGNAGGLVGNNAGGTIANCYARGSVTSTNNNASTGGLLGYMISGSVTNSFAASVINNAGTYGRGFAGGFNSGTAANSFWDIDVSGKVSGGAGTGTTTASMKTLTTFSDSSWDFDTIWGLQPSENLGYPYLQAGAPGYNSLVIIATGQGSFTVNSSAYLTPVTFASGTSVTVVANASSGWSFISWEDNSTSSNRTLIMDTDKSLTALFTEDATPSPSASTTLTISATGQGSFTVDSSAYLAPITFASGTSVTILATANSGWTFVSWEDNSTSLSRILVMDTDKSLTALFTEDEAETGDPPIPVPAPIPEASAPAVGHSSGGTTIQGRIYNLISMGNYFAAEEVRREWAHLFPNGDNLIIQELLKRIDLLKQQIAELQRASSTRR